MNLIEAYIIEVGRRLPAKGREDVQQEIRSLLQDALEDRSARAGRPVDEAMMVEALKEFGAPDQVAINYGAVNYLVGPRFYPIFLMVAKIVLPIIGVLALVGMGISLAQPGQTAISVLEGLFKALGGFLSAVIQALGSLTLIFVILERTIPEIVEKPGTWDPRSLEKVEPPSKVGVVGPVIEIAINLVLLVLFNFYAQSIGFYGFNNDQTWAIVPALGEGFYRLLPLLNVAFVAEIALHLVLLRQGDWRPWTRWFSIGLHVLWIALAIAMLTGPALLAIDAQKVVEAGAFPAESAEVVAGVLNQVMRWVLVVVAILSGVEIVKTALKLRRAQ